MKPEITMLLLGLVIALGGWNLTQTFNLSTGQVVVQEKVDELEDEVGVLTAQINSMKDLDEEIMDQHEDFIKALQQGNQSNTYNY